MFGLAFLLDFFAFFIHERNSVVCPNGGRLSILVVRVSLAEGVGRSLRHADEAYFATTLTRLQVNRKGKIMPLTPAAQVSSRAGDGDQHASPTQSHLLLLLSVFRGRKQGSEIRILPNFRRYAMHDWESRGCLSGV